MPKTVNFQANERVDQTDLDAATSGFTRDAMKLNRASMVLDNQSRILRGFRVELPDQNSYPGRVTIHGGIAFDKEGTLLFTEDQDKISRTITLEGANSNFYIEIEFTEADSDVDSRAFWDPTVDQGTDPSGDERPDGQEFSNNIATRKNPDWKIVNPVSTTSFQRDSIPTSTRVPVIHLVTDASNKITGAVNPGLTTEKFATTLLEQIGTTQLRVQDPYLLAGVGNSITVSEGAGSSEIVTVSKIDYDAGLVTTSSMSNSHSPGDIIRSQTATEPDFIVEADYGRYRRAMLSNQIDFRDKLFQGDEKHGEVLSMGHGAAALLSPDRSDVNLQSLKDQVDFLSAQLSEMKWGAMDPWLAKDSNFRCPPGLQANLPGTPRYFDRVSGLMGGRSKTITIGDGVNSWGDLNGNDAALITQALGLLPSTGGTIFLKRGTYYCDGGVSWGDGIDATLQGEEGTIIDCLNGNYWYIDSMTGVTIKNVVIRDGDGSSQVGIYLDTSPNKLILEEVSFTNCQLLMDTVTPNLTSFKRCTWTAFNASMATTSLVKLGAGAGAYSLHGVFDDCIFYHLTSSALANSLIDLTNSTAAAPANGLTFKDCQFYSFDSSIFAPTIHLGTSPYNVNFERCEFGAGTALCHVYFLEGEQLQIRNCNNLTPHGLVQCFTSEQITIVANRGVDQGFTSIYCLNCSRVKIKDNHFTTNSGISLFFKSIHFEITADVEDYLIEGNTIIGNPSATFNLTLGVHFDIKDNAKVFRDIKMIGNTFQTLEVGVFFAHSVGTGGIYEDVMISNNSFIDKSSDTQKLALTAGSATTTRRWMINNNTFRGIDPSTTATFAGLGRYGIYLQSTSNTHISIQGNSFVDVGTTVFAVPASAITCGSMGYGTISNNVIENVQGTFAYGIQASWLSGNNHVVVSGNQINHIVSTTGFAIGLNFDATSDCTITGNDIYSVSSATASMAYMMWWNGGSGNGATNTVISGNTMQSGGPADCGGIRLEGEYAFKLTITGNKMNYLRFGVYILPAGGTPDFNQVVIADNVIDVSSGSLTTYAIYLNGVNVAYVNRGAYRVCNNVITARGAGISSAIYITQLDKGVIVANNDVHVTDAGATSYAIVVDNTRMFQVIHNNIFNLTSNDIMIKADHASNNVFVIAFNIVDYDTAAPVSTSISTNGAGTPGIVGLNLCDEAPSGSVSHYNIASSNAGLATGGTQFIGY